jgi:hypothetical protein
VRPLLAPARDDDQRVVDRDAQAEQGDQELHDRRDRGQLGQPEQEQEGGHDRRNRHQERDDRQERGEDEDQNRERTGAADDGLEQQTRPLVVGSRVLEQGVEPSEVNGLAGDRGALERPGGGLLGERVLAERGVRIGLRVDDREGRRAVLGDERVRARGRVRRDPRVRQCLLEARFDLLEVGAHSGGVDRLAVRKRDDRHQRRGVAARAVIEAGDRLVRLPAFLVGNRELRLEGIGGGPSRRHAGDREGYPEPDDDLLVGQDPTGERRHVLPPDALR